jgi:hypothetical protein
MTFGVMYVFVDTDVSDKHIAFIIVSESGDFFS